MKKEEIFKYSRSSKSINILIIFNTIKDYIVKNKELDKTNLRKSINESLKLLIQSENTRKKEIQSGINVLKTFEILTEVDNKIILSEEIIKEINKKNIKEEKLREILLNKIIQKFLILGILEANVENKLSIENVKKLIELFEKNKINETKEKIKFYIKDEKTLSAYLNMIKDLFNPYIKILEKEELSRKKENSTSKKQNNQLNLFP